MYLDIFWHKFQKPVSRVTDYPTLLVLKTASWFLVQFSICSSDFSRFCSRDSVHPIRRKCSFNRDSLSRVTLYLEPEDGYPVRWGLGQLGADWQAGIVSPLLFILIFDTYVTWALSNHTHEYFWSKLYLFSYLLKYPVRYRSGTVGAETSVPDLRHFGTYPDLVPRIADPDLVTRVANPDPAC